MSEETSTDRHAAGAPAAGDDLLALAAFVALVDVAIVGGLLGAGSPLRVVLGLPTVLFAPGYALVAAAYPGRGPAVVSPAREAGPGVDLVERVALSMGMSVVVAPAYVLVLAPVGLVAPVPILLLASVATGAGAVVASIRRSSLAPEARFRVPLFEWVRWAQDGVSPGATHRWLNVALGVVVVTALLSVTFALAASPQRSAYTSTALLTRSGDGGFVEGGYPDVLAPGRTEPVWLRVANHEGAETRYTVVAELQRVRGSGGDLRVVDRSRLRRGSFTLADGGSRTFRVPVAGDATGPDQRVTVYVYRGDAPARPSATTANETLFFWVDVGTGGGAGGTTDGGNGAGGTTPPPTETTRTPEPTTPAQTTPATTTPAPTTSTPSTTTSASPPGGTTSTTTTPTGPTTPTTSPGTTAGSSTTGGSGGSSTGGTGGTATGTSTPVQVTVSEGPVINGTTTAAGSSSAGTGGGTTTAGGTGGSTPAGDVGARARAFGGTGLALAALGLLVRDRTRGRD